MLVYETEAVELPGGQPIEPLLHRVVGRQVAWPPVAVRQAVPVLPSDSSPAQHHTQPSEPRVRGSLCHPAAMRQIFSRFARFWVNLRCGLAAGRIRLGDLRVVERAGFEPAYA